MSGRILVQPINGIGDITLILRNVHMTFDEDWKFIPRDGEKYVFIENVTSSVVPGSVNVNITNLFGGNKLLGDQMNIFLNENWKQLFKDLSPVIFKIFAEVLASSLNTITTDIPFDTMFPERIPK
ncbi:protein takeout-like [Zootermopsis nevadensis]|nr:protein takeout-like [Zootermopsis nevadensis]